MRRRPTTRRPPRPRRSRRRAAAAAATCRTRHAARQRSRCRRAGALGVIETSSGETANCQREIAQMVASGLPFGVNLPIRFLKDDAMLRFVCEAGIRFVTTSAGSPAKFIAPLKAAGIVVYHAVPTLETALKCVDAGVDGLVVEGAEGGGFKNPEEVSTLVLLQAIRERVDVPLIAAGEATGTWVLKKKATPCIRALKTARTQAMHEAGLMPADAFAGIQQVYFGGDMEAAPALAGQSAGLIHAVLPVQQIIDDTVAEFHAIAARLGALAAARQFG